MYPGIDQVSCEEDQEAGKQARVYHHQVLNVGEEDPEDQFKGIEEGFEDLGEGVQYQLKKIEGCKDV